MAPRVDPHTRISTSPSPTPSPSGIRKEVAATKADDLKRKQQLEAELKKLQDEIDGSGDAGTTLPRDEDVEATDGNVEEEDQSGDHGEDAERWRNEATQWHDDYLEVVQENIRLRELPDYISVDDLHQEFESLYFHIRGWVVRTIENHDFDFRTKLLKWSSVRWFRAWQPGSLSGHTSDEFKNNALICLLGMTWVRFHLHAGPFGPSTKLPMSAYVQMAKRLEDKAYIAEYRPWLISTRKWLDKYYPDDISDMMQRRRDGIAEAFFDSIHHATNFKLDDELRRQLRRLADRAATLSDHLHASPATYELPPYEVWYDPKKSTVPRYSRETHEDMDRVNRPDDVYVACHALVWPGLSQHADERCQNVEDNVRRVKSRIRVTTMPLPDD
ncbi:hypothetical protein BDZ85DRAFT_13863 [Elsinoe ampelina]|uniref:Uncharacterized protein n=1 Tax=Elsinoe ampelina TaxID=302913 RepID=A0A6A6GR94_9PEZI|nr:hypothetical protein BDZ85DRAFT_13863 [Elsinoe ampelina]